MELEQTLIIIKPDGLIKSLTGNILTRLSEAKLIIIGAKLVKVSDALARRHYAHLAGKPFFNELIRYLTGELHSTHRVLALVYEGEDAIKKIRYIVGATNPEKAHPVSIRGAYGRITTKGIFENCVHASGSVAEAEKEIKMWFSPDEIAHQLYPTKKIEIYEKTELVWS